MGQELPEGSCQFQNNALSVICIHALFKKMDLYKLDERNFRNFEGNLLNEQFLDFNSVWECNMIIKLREHSGLPTNKQFKTLDIYQRDDCGVDDDYEDLL